MEAGKKAAARVLELQAKTLAYLADNKGKAFTADQIAGAIGADAEDVFHVARHIAANKPGVVYTTGANPAADTVSLA